MASMLVSCRYCDSKLVYKHGYGRGGSPRYRCRACGRSFQQVYHYEGHKVGVPDKIIEKS